MRYWWMMHGDDRQDLKCPFFDCCCRYLVQSVSLCVVSFQCHATKHTSCATGCWLVLLLILNLTRLVLTSWATWHMKLLPRYTTPSIQSAHLINIVKFVLFDISTTLQYFGAFGLQCYSAHAKLGINQLMTYLQLVSSVWKFALTWCSISLLFASQSTVTLLLRAFEANQLLHVELTVWWWWRWWW